MTDGKLVRFCAEKGAAQNIKTAKIVCIRADTLILRPQLLNTLICNTDPALHLPSLGLQLKRQETKISRWLELFVLYLTPGTLDQDL